MVSVSLAKSMLTDLGQNKVVPKGLPTESLGVEVQKVLSFHPNRIRHT